MGPKDVLRGYADDLAAVLFEGLQTLMSIARVFQVVKTISGLNLKISKTVIIPLGRQGTFKMKASICDSLPHWSGVLVSSSGKYLGFHVGPGAGDQSWEEPAAKWTTRSGQIKATRCGMHFSACIYNTTAITTMSFVAQLVPVTRELLKKEASILNSLAGCARGAITPACMHNLKVCGMPVSFKSLSAISMASLFRVAHETSKDWRIARDAYTTASESDDAPILGFSTSDNIFLRPQIFSIL